MKIPESLPYLPDHQHESSAIKKTLKRSNSLSKIESQTETDISFLNTTHAFDRPSLKSLVENKNIIIVSNRGLSSINNTLSALPGGLATAVIDSLYSISKAQDGNQSASWISWDGKNNQTQTGVAVHYPPGEGTNSHPFNVHQFSIEKDLLDTFYRVVNNQTLFPALHSDPADSEYTRSIIPCSNADWDKYEEVNGLFAQYAFNCLSPGKENLVWFQDSQIMMAPKKLRTLIENSDIQDLLKDTKIGYFHHMTWPDKQSLINCLISRDEVWGKDLGTGLRRAVALANTLLQCDALGFHIPKDAKNFVSLIEDEQVNHHLKDLNDAFSIRFDGSNNTITIAYNNVHKNYHEVKIEAHPIGITANNDNIDLGKTESTADAKHEIISQLTTRWKEGNELGINDQTKDVFLDPNTLIFYSIERHEPNKNTNLRIDAIEKYLETSMPKNKIIFMMTLAPTRGDIPYYRDYQNLTQKKVKMINAKFNEKLGYSPIILTGQLGAEKNRYMMVADSLIINAKKDGMNLTLFEYINQRKFSPLPSEAIVSVHSGVGDRLRADADRYGLNPPVILLNDPQDLNECIHAIRRAAKHLTKARSKINDDRVLPSSDQSIISYADVLKSESAFNMEKLKHFMKQQNVDTWLLGNLSMLTSAYSSEKINCAISTPLSLPGPSQQIFL